MRVLPDTDYTVPIALSTDDSVIRVKHLRSSRAADLEAQIAAEVAAVVALNAVGINWRIMFADVGGSGYGDTFTAALHFINSDDVNVSVNEGQDLASAANGNIVGTRLFLYEAADKIELAREWDRAWERISAFLASLGAVPGIESVETGLAGATQGTKYLGFILARVTP